MNFANLTFLIGLVIIEARLLLFSLGCCGPSMDGPFLFIANLDLLDKRLSDTLLVSILKKEKEMPYLSLEEVSTLICLSSQYDAILVKRKILPRRPKGWKQESQSELRKKYEKVLGRLGGDAQSMFEALIGLRPFNELDERAQGFLVEIIAAAETGRGINHKGQENYCKKRLKELRQS